MTVHGVVYSKISIIIKNCKTEAFEMFVVILNRGRVKAFEFTRRGAI